MKKKLFILGIGGLTGSKLSYLAKNDFEVYGSYNLRNPRFDFMKGIKLDISNIHKVKEILTILKPDVLINTCAISSVDYCESHQDEAKKINIDMVREICKITNSLGIKFVHLSSDSVFDGTKETPYLETDIPNPINYYGHTKMVSELIVLENSDNLVVRASVLYGWLPKELAELPSSSMKPTNFAQWLINKLRSHEQVKIITDELSSPIIVDDFAKSILHLVNGNFSGIFHSSPQIQITRYDFSKYLASSLDLDSKLIQSTTNKELGRKVTTAFNKCIDSSKMVKETNFEFLSLENSVSLLRKQCN